MKIKVLINSYNRLPMLRKVVRAWREVGAEVHVFDDGSDFEPFTDMAVTWHRFDHHGKRGYWKIWDAMLKEAKNAEAPDLIVFTPDDFTKPQIERIKEQHKRLIKYPYAFNLINDGRLACWNAFMPRVIDAETIQVGFTDCGFFCNRLALETIGFYMAPVPEEWLNTHGSSGVGAQLTKRMNKRHVTMLTPQRSFAYHGTHESKMHPEGRKRVPLKSR